jgi:Double-GTPase 2
MSASASETAPEAKASKPPVSLVVCGLPGSGKTSLLGALAVAAVKQPALLGGQFTTVPEELKNLARRVYSEDAGSRDATAGRQGEQLFSYPVSYLENGAEELAPAILTDCSGPAAEELLHNKEGLDARKPIGSLARSVRTADGLIILLDASATPLQMEQQFAVFSTFLHKLEEGRGKRTEISGLPVFLVLTKCDLLAKPTDSMMDWMETIEQRKREVGEAFREFLAREAPVKGRVPFGRTDLQVWATAIKRPALQQTPAKPYEPFGVAELFRQSLEKADDYRVNREKAGRRLFWTASISAGVVLLMGWVTAGLAFYNLEKPQSELEQRLNAYLFSEPASSAERMRGISEEDLRKRLTTLQEIRSDPEFSALTEAQRQTVTERIKEIEDYLNYLARVRQTPNAANLIQVARLREQRKKLETELAPPPEWKETVAGALQRELLADYNCLVTAVDEYCQWFRENGRKAQALWTFEAEDLRGAAWNSRARALLEKTSKIPFAGDETLPNCPTLKPGTALVFDEVSRDRAYFERMRNHLLQLRDLLAALGMLGPITDPPPVLAIPDSFTLASADEILRTLRKAYPDFEKEFVLQVVPEKLRGEVVESARTYYKTLLEPARRLVADRQKEKGWEGVASWLKNPSELAHWRVLAVVLNRLRDRSEGLAPVDPVSDLERFLQTKSFTIKAPSLVLVVPDELSGRVPNNARLTIACTSSDGERRTLVYYLEDSKGRPEGENKLYTFGKSGDSEIVYKPGEEMQASLPLLGGGVLRWVSQKSARYQFGRLELPPRLYRNDEPESESSLERRVHLRKVPHIPDLLPQSAYE